MIEPVNYRNGNLIPAAGTVIIGQGGVAAVSGANDPFLAFGTQEPDYIAMQVAMTFGAGGVSIDAYLQTTFDDGLTWIDIINLQVLAASVRKVAAVNKFLVAGTAGLVTVTDGALGANTVVNGTIGQKFRLKLILVGTYDAASTYRVNVIAQKIR